MTASAQAAGSRGIPGTSVTWPLACRGLATSSQGWRILVNSALLLLTAAWGADAPVVTSEVMPGPGSYGCACCSSCERGGFLSWLRGPWMGWGKGYSEPVKCDHPGPIPGSEHPTKCQMLKERWCPCECKYSGRPKAAEIAEWPCKPTGRYYVIPEPDYGPNEPPARHVCSRDWSWLPFNRCGKRDCSGCGNLHPCKLSLGMLHGHSCEHEGAGCGNLHPCYNSPRGLWNRTVGRLGCSYGASYGSNWEEDHAVPSD